MASSARIEELEKKFNENPRRYFAPLANEYRKAGETEQAIALCRAYLPQQPGHMSGHIVFGQALFDAGEIDEAQGVFETALTLDPENLIALRHLGDIAHSRGDIAGARGWYRRVLDADPRNEEIAAQLAALPDDGSASATESTPSGAAGSVGWGDINPERSQAEAAGDETPSVSRASSGAPASADVPAAATPKAEPLEIERASASEDDDIDIDALFSTTDAPSPAPAAGSDSADSGDIAALADEETAEVPVFRESRDDEPTLEVAIKPDAPAVEEPPATHEEPARAAAPSDGLGLEVAEFIPPPATESSERALGFETGHEAVVGGPVDGPPGGTRSSETPAGFVTETMAELYLQQGFIQEALNVYRQLLEQNPGDEALRERVAQLEQGARSSVSMAAVSDEVVEAARKRQASPNRRSMRQFLGALAARRAPNRVSGEREARGSDPIEEAQPEHLEPIENEASAEDLPYEAEPQVAELQYEAPEPEPAPDLPFEPAEPEAAMPYEPPPAVMTPRGGHEPEPFSRTGSAPASGEAGLDALFAGNGIDPDDQAAATTLAGAFDAATMPAAPSGPRGRPTRAAPSELSLDHVFRESGGDAGLQRPRSDFSFDQFFSDEASDASQRSNGDEGPPEPAGEPPSPDDIGQFNAWLEGLKKK